MSCALRMMTLFCLIACEVQAARQVVVGTHDTEAESMPSFVSDAIRKATSLAQQALNDAKVEEAAVKEQTAKAKEAAQLKEKAEAEKENAAKEASASQKEASAIAKKAAQAAREKIDSSSTWKGAEEARQEAEDAFVKATDDYNDYATKGNAEIREIKRKLSDKEAAMDKAKTEFQKAFQKTEEARVAYEVAAKEDDAQVKDLKVATDKLEEATGTLVGKSADAKIAGREAESAQIALDDATSRWNAAKEAVQQKETLRDHLWELYDAIEAFYDTSSDVVRAMRKSVRAGCTKEPHECLTSDGPGGALAEIKDALVNYNSMVLAFMKIKDRYPSVYTDIQPAEAEIETNSMSQIKLACDPVMKLENSLTPAEFNDKCGEGLWPALDLTKNRFYEP